jgi:hypothetical protein
LDSLYIELLRAVLPVGVLDYFDVTGLEHKGEQLSIDLEEKNVLPDGYRDQPCSSSVLQKLLK